LGLVTAAANQSTSDWLQLRCRLVGSWRPGRRAKRVGPGRAEHFADWHGVAVLLKICSHHIDGQSDAKKRITNALGIQDTRPESESGDERDYDSEQAS
jgi:hypothetical protein